MECTQIRTNGIFICSHIILCLYIKKRQFVDQLSFRRRYFTMGIVKIYNVLGGFYVFYNTMNIFFCPSKNYKFFLHFLCNIYIISIVIFYNLYIYFLYILINLYFLHIFSCNLLSECYNLLNKKQKGFQSRRYNRWDHS